MEINYQPIENQSDPLERLVSARAGALTPHLTTHHAHASVNQPFFCAILSVPEKKETL